MYFSYNEFASYCFRFSANIVQIELNLLLRTCISYILSEPFSKWQITVQVKDINFVAAQHFRANAFIRTLVNQPINEKNGTGSENVSRRTELFNQFSNITNSVPSLV